MMASFYCDCCCSNGALENSTLENTGPSVGFAIRPDETGFEEMGCLPGIEKDAFENRPQPGFAVARATDKAMGNASSSKKEGQDGVVEFEVTIQSNQTPPSIGLEIDCLDHVTAVVCAITPNGAAAAFNRSHAKELNICVNDLIVEINGAKGSAQHLLDKITQDSTWKLIIRRPREFSVILKPGRPLGVDLAYTDCGKTLLITSVNKGPLQEWTNSKEGRPVVPMDRVVAIDEYRGSPAEMLARVKDMVKATEGVVITIVPFTVDDKGPRRTMSSR